MHHTIRVSPRFSPPYSLLGVLLRRIIADRRQAEGAYLLIIPSLILLVLLGSIMAWPYVAADILADARGATAVRYFTVQASCALVVLVLGGVGFAPAVHVKVNDHTLTVRQGSRRRSLPLSVIQDWAVVTSLDFHRQYRYLLNVEAYIGRMTSQVMVLRSGASQVAIGLREEDCETLGAAFSAVLAPRPVAAV